MKWIKWTLKQDTSMGDPLPIIIGCFLLLISLPSLILLIFIREAKSDTIALPLIFLFVIGNILGFISLIYGIRWCTFPGTFLYRLSRGRIFFR